MPEGDTVHRAARLLDRSLSGQVLTRSDFRVPRHATADLAGAGVVETVSRGKHLLTRIDDSAAGESWTLHTHLKMEGSWRVYRPGQRWSRPTHQARVVLETARSVAVGWGLGVVELLPRDREDDVVGHLGPDLLGPDWDEDEALQRLREDRARPVGEALLDQTRLAGIGNMYIFASESRSTAVSETIGTTTAGPRPAARTGTSGSPIGQSRALLENGTEDEKASAGHRTVLRHRAVV